MKRLALAAALSATALSATALFTSAQAQPPALTAPPPAAAEQPCLRIGQVYDFQTVAGNRSLIVIDRSRRKYKLSFNGICPDLQYNLGLGFKSFGIGQLSCIQRGDYVIANDPAVPFNRCAIQKVDAYTPAMEQADAAAAEAAKAH